MFLTGANAKAPGTYALTQVANLLETRLHSAPYAAMFAPWGQVEVCQDWATATKKLGGKRPLLVLELGGAYDDPDANLGKGKRRKLLEISIELVVGQWCAGAESMLKDALIDVLEAEVDTLDALALEESEIRAGQGRVEVPGRINPHTLFLAVHTNTLTP